MSWTRNVCSGVTANSENSLHNWVSVNLIQFQNSTSDQNTQNHQIIFFWTLLINLFECGFCDCLVICETDLAASFDWSKYDKEIILLFVKICLLLCVFYSTECFIRSVSTRNTQTIEIEQTYNPYPNYNEKHMNCLWWQCLKM